MMNAIPSVADAPTEWLASLSWQPVDKKAFSSLTHDEQLIRIRHSTAHVMASALMRLYPGIQFATGPATPTGFFYDVKLPEGTPLKQDDLQAIEAAMKTEVGRAYAFEYTEVLKADAVVYFSGQGQGYKLQTLEKIPSETVTLYRSGEFIDLCAGPHVTHTGLCSAFQLTGIAASHWKDELHPSLIRVTGTSWKTPKDLKRYLEFVEDSKTRDHRVLGPQLELFQFHPWAAGAMWAPKGVKMRRTLEGYWRELLERYGYEEISNPILYKKELFECSGHWHHYQDNMFLINDAEGNPEYGMKPMNCPDTMLYFKSTRRSYRELPMRIAEGQLLHRNEATGAMHGLMRTRMFTQDDAHIFATQEQIQSEVTHLFKMLDEVYSLFQLDYQFTLSTRPDEFLGDIAVWNEAEESLKAALNATGRPYEIEEGEGAFYGPKIDVQIRDSLGRLWQCGTFQLDYQLPERFELGYIDADGSTKRPIVIHRAIFGSFERFLGILVEHLGGAFPTWLAPVQVAVLPIGADHLSYAEEVQAKLKAKGIRTILEGEDTINYRVRQCETSKIPTMLIVGGREAEEGTVSVRRYHVGEKKVLPLEECIAGIVKDVETRALNVTLKTYDDLFFRPAATLSTEASDY
jgi:threonyl-tRNA synthetase